MPCVAQGGAHLIIVSTVIVTVEMVFAAESPIALGTNVGGALGGASRDGRTKVNVGGAS
jgi:hypothetical protein